jgi:hypothetical protein
LYNNRKGDIMLITKKEMVEEEVPESLTCDICKTSFSFEKDWEEIEECQHVHFEGGYGSVFGDGKRYKLDICQHCIKRLLGKFLIEDIDNYEEDDEDDEDCASRDLE